MGDTSLWFDIGEALHYNPPAPPMSRVIGPPETAMKSISFRGHKQALKFGQVPDRLLVVLPRPVKIEGIQSGLPGIEEIKLPVIADVDDLARPDTHFFTYPEIEIRAFYLLVV